MLEVDATSLVQLFQVRTSQFSKSRTRLCSKMGIKNELEKVSTMEKTMEQTRPNFSEKYNQEQPQQDSVFKKDKEHKS